MQLLKDIYNRAEALKGPRLIVITGVLSIIFLGFGILIGYINNRILNTDEPSLDSVATMPVTDVSVTYEGKVSYTNPEYYPGEDISYVLTDSEGKDVILLRSDDAKLSIAEGLFVKVEGRESRTKSGTKYLLVKEVILNASN